MRVFAILVAPCCAAACCSSDRPPLIFGSAVVVAALMSSRLQANFHEDGPRASRRFRGVRDHVSRSVTVDVTRRVLVYGERRPSLRLRRNRLAVVNEALQSVDRGVSERAGFEYECYARWRAGGRRRCRVCFRFFSPLIESVVRLQHTVGVVCLCVWWMAPVDE